MKIRTLRHPKSVAVLSGHLELGGLIWQLVYYVEPLHQNLVFVFIWYQRGINIEGIESMN
ncbi:hypothetical protein COO91_08615 [Nostoc flagelliforme CCNUN1]|uniref:Uncharacterized protein n=1 Tax=Nostoc flagelliforme CCNUN1 TaxID=2038116 RepID=A0A2K8T4H3_9NOSO|nr:hypothetical protein COO91_08615 [Nostoc flagelliforme CCNUN1]